MKMLSVRYFSLTLILFSTLAASPAAACRCRPQILEQYYQTADLVFLAKIGSTSLTPEGRRRAEFELLEPSFKGDPSTFTQLTTSSTSASCGITFTPGANYIFFVQPETQTSSSAEVHSCNGTRRIDLEVDTDHQIFPELPRKFLIPRLTTLFANHIGIGGTAKPDSIIGLHEFPLTQLYSSASTDSKKLASDIAVKTRESSYEVKAAIVYEKRAAWLRMKTTSGNDVWMKKSPSNTFHPLETLLPGRLSYLTKHFSGALWPEPGAGTPLRITFSKEQSIEIHKTNNIADSLWLYVSVLKNNPCEGEPRVVAASGWIPAWNAAGELTTWYWSRGC